MHGGNDVNWECFAEFLDRARAVDTRQQRRLLRFEWNAARFVVGRSHRANRRVRESLDQTTPVPSRGGAPRSAGGLPFIIPISDVETGAAALSIDGCGG